MSDLKAKMHHNRFWLGLGPRPRWGSLQRSPGPLAGLRGRTSKGKGGVRGMGGAIVGKGKNGGKRRDRASEKEKGRGGKRGGDEREREGDTRHTTHSLLPAPLMLLDLSAAFHTVDHQILADVLRRRFGIAGGALDWMVNFLSDRSQVVRVGSKLLRIWCHYFAVWSPSGIRPCSKEVPGVR